MKRIVLVVGAVVVILIAVLIGRALGAGSMQIAVPSAPPLTIDRQPALARFARAIQFRTVSFENRAPSGEHDAFVAWLAQAYPRVHASLRREVVNGKSLLFTWSGSDPALAPVLLMGHYDVVPVEPGTESKWEQPPFSGAVSGGYVWGRGTIDDKLTVISVLESAELLVGEGFRPKRTVLFSFGHDEEIGGHQGAEQIAKLLASRGVKLDAVFDEGGVIMLRSSMTPRPLALVGIAEKGSVSVELLASGHGGHSSMPPPRTPVGVIAAAVDRVQSRPFHAGVRGATAEFFRWLAPELPFGKRVVMSNLWLFEPLLEAQAKGSNSLNAMLRTTTAPTIIQGGVKENVIPSQARAVINFRILPGDTAAFVTEHVRTSIDDANVKIRVAGHQDPSSVSDARARQFRTIQRTISQVYPEAVVAPYLVVGATDSRHFSRLTANAYRFIPLPMTEADLQRFHGTNERIAVNDYFEAIRFYRTLLVNVAR
jgi:carboxypeptidase PM20D1